VRACYDACPVKIDIPSLLVHLRARHVEETARATGCPPEAVTRPPPPGDGQPGAMAAAQGASRLGRVLGRGGRIRRLPPPLSAWTAARDAPEPPRQTFREWWRKEHGDRP